MPDTPAAPAREVRPFTKFLHEQRRGGLHEDLGAALAEVCAAVIEHGKGGEVVLKIRIKAAGDMVQITDEVIAKVPVGEKAASMFFVDQTGNVSRSNPRQPELPIRSVDDKDERQVS